MKRYLLSTILSFLIYNSAVSQIVIVKSNPSNAYAAAIASPSPTTSGPNPLDLCGQAWTAGGVPGGWRTFFILNDSALAGITIDSAIMQLWADPTTGWGYYGTPMYGTNNACVLYRITSPWATTINWLTMPSYTSVDSVILPQSTSTTENYLHINVTNLLNDIVASGYNYGYMLKSRQETTPYNSMMFHSSSAPDSSVRPQILIYGHGSDHVYFTNGHTQSLTICVSEATATVPVNTQLAAIDSVSGLTETWSLITPPSHGTALTSYTTLSTGSILIPVGLTYTPVSGYTGTDLFKTVVSNGAYSDTTTINIIINPYPDPGTISGVDSVCPGESVNLSESSSDGFWSTSNYTVSGIASSGVAEGLIPGMDTIVYTVSNSCGISSAIFPFVVRSYSQCHTGINIMSEGERTYTVYPDPACDELNVSSSSIIYHIAVSNVVGEIVYTSEFNANQIKLNIQYLPAGVYFLRINSSEVKKFVKR